MPLTAIRMASSSSSESVWADSPPVTGLAKSRVLLRPVRLEMTTPSAFVEQGERGLVRTGVVERVEADEADVLKAAAGAALEVVDDGALLLEFRADGIDPPDVLLEDVHQRPPLPSPTSARYRRAARERRIDCTRSRMTTIRRTAAIVPITMPRFSLRMRFSSANAAPLQGGEADHSDRLGLGRLGSTVETVPASAESGCTGLSTRKRWPDAAARPRTADRSSVPHDALLRGRCPLPRPVPHRSRRRQPS